MKFEEPKVEFIKIQGREVVVASGTPEKCPDGTQLGGGMVCEGDYMTAPCGRPMHDTAANS